MVGIHEMHDGYSWTNAALRTKDNLKLSVKRKDKIKWERKRKRCLIPI